MCFYRLCINSNDFMFTNAWLNIPKILQCLQDTIYKSTFNHFFSMLRMNNLCNRYYINTLSRVFYTKYVMKALKISE